MPAVAINSFQRAAPCDERFAKAVNASTPPSPLLSNLSIIQTYLMEMMSIIAQNKADSVASTLASVGASPCAPAKASLNAYNGLVPMSPYTTPSAANANVLVAVF